MKFAKTRGAAACWRIAVCVLSVTVIGLMTVACSTSRIGSDFDRSVDFSDYRTFSWMSKPLHRPHGQMETLDVHRTREAIQAVLERRGYVYAADGTAADFLVDFTIAAGTLSIHAFDARSHRHVWHGWARRALTQPGMEGSEAPIQAAVEAIFEKFPSPLRKDQGASEAVAACSFAWNSMSPTSLVVLASIRPSLSSSVISNE